jgi:hypothetical protein
MIKSECVLINIKLVMSEENPNIFFHNQESEEGDQAKDNDFNNAQFELTDEEKRNQVRNNIFKALTEADNSNELALSQFPPAKLTELIEEPMINEFKD